jgi:hypothetical protein
VRRVQAINSRRESARLSQLGELVMPMMIDNSIAAAKAAGARIVLPGTRSTITATMPFRTSKRTRRRLVGHPAVLHL